MQKIYASMKKAKNPANNHIKNFIVDEINGKEYTINQVAKLLSRSVNTIYGWYTTHKCTTIAKCIKRSDKIKIKTVNHGNLHETCRGKFTSKQIAEIAGVSRPTIVDRARKHGWDSDLLWLKRIEPIDLET